MKLPISWLRDWIEIDADAAAVADALTRRGFYVEGIDERGGSFPGVVVARVVDVARHPNADKLSLCRVDGGGEELRVVCGAPNVRAGMLVPLATVGAKLPGDVVIRKSKIRGEESQGMLCSAREMGLSDDHEGILDLALWRPGATLVPGAPFDALLDPPDSVLEVEVPFNRPDGLGVVGLAREVKAALGGAWTPGARARLAARWTGRADFDLELEDTEGCPRYIAQALEGVRIEPSPRWLVTRLEAMGQRAVNNVVDVTNLVLFEFGQPLHAFDLSRLKGPSIRVRRAQAGEKLTTLDGRERALDPEVLVVADKERPVAVAGVMGGAETEVTAETMALLLECAYFQPQRVRRGSRFLGLSTEASKRYERGVDPEIGPAAAARFLGVLRELVPEARPLSARERNHADGKRRTLNMRSARVHRLTGLDLGPAEAKRHLEALEFGAEAGDPLRVTVPSWRGDVTLEEDLVEEVARAHGYDRIPDKPLETGGVFAVRSPRERLVARARDAMRARGLHEAWTPTLVAEREAMDAGGLLGESASSLVRLSNPVSREGEVLRPSPVPGLLAAVRRNLGQGVESVRLFEAGAGFVARGGALPEEPLMLAAVLCGARWSHAHDASQGAVEFADLKGVCEAWLGEMRVDTPIWRAYSAPGWKPGASAEVASGTSRIGWAGTLHPTLLRAWDIEVPVHLFVVLLDSLDRAPTPPAMSVPDRFPPVRRDVAFFVPAAVTHHDVESALARAGGDRLQTIELFDVYAGPGTPEGMKSLAYALRFQHPERTLTESEVQAIQDRMVAALAKECGGRLRER
ncbi:MAG TPA: phenylalanine--tRNA ligase subunit beta [Candidatus Saccharimonadaceae bacterium]|jgi:phenylalanyl-tRNA synthetase beta chain|nr:phenylalanine--tRNA ligase subunit beta [Candidatus Saccharimonadaceae bacterium]